MSLIVRVNRAVWFSHRDEIHIDVDGLKGLTPDQLFNSVKAASRHSRNELYVEQCASGIGPFDETRAYTVDEFLEVIEAEHKRRGEMEDLRIYAAQARKEFNSRRDEFVRQMMPLVNPECAFPGCHSYNVTLDHIVPLILGGENHVDNFQWLCRSHNSSKGAKVVRFRP